MIYRVDYLLAIILAGFIAGALTSAWASRIQPSRLARGYFVLTAMLVALRLVFFVCSVVAVKSEFWAAAGGPIGDGGNFLLGVIFGLAMRRPERREILCDPAVHSALCLWSGFSFVIAGYTKALYTAGMIDFFTQSGYSTPFLKFVMTAEILGGIGLLIPWTVLPAIAGLSVDMFGAVWTHIHNGDSINDSTGAIGQLVRLGAIAAIWAWQRRTADSHNSARRRFTAVAVGATLCAVMAVAGSALLRRAATPASQQYSQPTKTG